MRTYVQIHTVTSNTMNMERYDLTASLFQYSQIIGTGCLQILSIQVYTSDAIVINAHSNTQYDGDDTHII
jgi:hypothetical protein